MKNDKMKSQYRINEQIRVREVRIVGDEGSSVEMLIRQYVVSSTTPSSSTSRRSARRR